MNKLFIAVLMVMAMCVNCFGSDIFDSGGNYATTTLENNWGIHDSFGGAITVPGNPKLTLEFIPDPYMPMVTPFDDEKSSYYPYEPKEYPAETIDGNGMTGMYNIKPSLIDNKEEVIKFFIESGDVCEVIGHHLWRDLVYRTMTLQACYDDYGVYTACPQPTYRKCNVCGKTQQESTVTEWIDVE